MYDAVIIGAGPAGVSAALYTKRAGLNTLIIHNNESALKYAKEIENYYGFEEKITGDELYKKGIKQAVNLGVELVEDEVIDLKYEGVFVIKTSKNEYISKNVVIATGTKRNKPNVKGIKEFEGRGISYCAICDGFFFKNKNISVIGSGNYAINELTHLLNVANKVTLLTNGKEAPMLRADNLEIIDKKIDSIDGKDKVESIRFFDSSKINIDGVFIAEGVASSTDLARKVGALINERNILVDENMKTSINGLYACGDAIGGILQVSIAIAEGAKVGMQIIKEMKNNK